MNFLEPTLASVRTSEPGDLLRAGDLLGDTYEVRGKLGEGGMGQVYEAYDRRLDRRVAIKVARPGLTVSAEARALAALRGHPSMVTVFALGLQHGMEYAVMELVHGATLEHKLSAKRAERARLAIDEIVDLGAALANGLAFVHAAGVAHRDVKPANVILAPNDRVVITDFGAFKPECDHTSSMLVWGTPDYMAPEVAVGRVEPGELFLVDMYALGIVLFEMLTGAVPFQGANAGYVALMHVREAVPDPAVGRPDTPGSLADLVRRMTAKVPAARPQSMQEVAWQLRHVTARAARAVHLPCDRDRSLATTFTVPG